MLNTLRNPVPREMLSPPGSYAVWNTSMGPGGHLRGMDVLIVRHSADWALPEQHTGSWERTATERVELPLHVMDCSERIGCSGCEIGQLGRRQQFRIQISPGGRALGVNIVPRATASIHTKPGKQRVNLTKRLCDALIWC